MHTPQNSAASSRSRAAVRKPAEISLVVPAFNEERGIEALVRAAAEQLKCFGSSYEILIVDDGSTDRTSVILDSLCDEIPAIRTIRLRVNSGQHIASYIGLREATGEFVFMADADLAEALPALAQLHAVAKADMRCDIVSAVRATRARALHRSLGSQAVGVLVNRLTGSELRDPASTLRLYRRRVVDAITDADVLAQNLPILTSLMGFSVREVDIEMRGSNRQSRYGLFALIHLLLLALLNFSAGTRTMLTLIGLGACSALVGVLGLTALTIHGIIAQLPLSTNLLLLFVMLIVVGLQFTLMGGIAYKIERINMNLRFRKLTADANYDE